MMLIFMGRRLCHLPAAIIQAQCKKPKPRASAGNAFARPTFRLMNPISSAFASAYLTCTVLAVASVFLRLSRPLTDGQRLLSGALLWPLILVYMAGMHRSAGTDFDNYLAAYNETGQAIPDLGYSAITWLAFRTGLEFPSFLLIQGIFTLATLWFVARVKRADGIVVLAFYLMHLAIVRDMSQSRIGMAVAIYLIGNTRERAFPKVLLYVLAASIHITVLALVLVSTLSTVGLRWPSARRALFIYAPLAALAMFGVGLLNLLSFVDPRIEFYLSWDDAAYGAPLESFGGLVRSALVIFVYVLASRRFKQLDLRPYIVMEVAAAAILIGFSQFSIFAARLSNVAISMYPIGLGVVACAYQGLAMEHRATVRGAAVKVAIALTVGALIFRPGSFEALLEVVPTVFAAAYGWD